jgi:SAM-dependent methyltransferase
VSNVVAAEIPSTVELVEQDRRPISYRNDRQVSEDSLIVPAAQIRRYHHPRADTVFPREYAFHLLGDVEGCTVLDLGCGHGVNTVILACLGARVVSIDISRQGLEVTGQRAIANKVGNRVQLLHSDATAIPIDAASVDAILCTGLMHHVDPITTARQMRRVLKPGGLAVFDEAIVGPTPFTEDNSQLNLAQVDAVCRAVGRLGRRREFWLTTRFVSRMPARTFSSAAKAAQRLDAAVLQRFPFARKLASPMVWEARKES